MAKRKYDADEDVELAGGGFVEEFCTKPQWDEDGVQSAAGIGLDGKEYGDPVPLEPPVGFENPPDLMEMMCSMIRNDAMQRRLEAEGFDTEEEAGDFDIDDDPLPPLTIHEALLATPKEPTPPPSPPSAVPQTSAETEGGGGAASATKAVPDTPSEPTTTSRPVRPST